MSIHHEHSQCILVQEAFKQQQHKLVHWTQVTKACHIFASHWTWHFDLKKWDKTFFSESSSWLVKYLLACHVLSVRGWWKNNYTHPPFFTGQIEFCLFSQDPPENYFLTFLLAPKLRWYPSCTGCIDWDSFTTFGTINVLARIILPLSNTVETISFPKYRPTCWLIPLARW